MGRGKGKGEGCNGARKHNDVSNGGLWINIGPCARLRYKRWPKEREGVVCLNSIAASCDMLPSDCFSMWGYECLTNVFSDWKDLYHWELQSSLHSIHTLLSHIQTGAQARSTRLEDSRDGSIRIRDCSSSTNWLKLLTAGSTKKNWMGLRVPNHNILLCIREVPKRYATPSTLKWLKKQRSHQTRRANKAN